MVESGSNCLATSAATWHGPLRVSCLQQFNVLHPATAAPRLLKEVRKELPQVVTGTSNVPASLNPEVWVDAYGDSLYRYAVSRVGNVTVAEDLVQEAFLAAIQSRHTFQGNANELTWLTGILRHKTLDFFRKTSRAKEQSLTTQDVEDDESLFNSNGTWGSPPSTWSSPHESLEKDEFWLQMQSCISALPEAMRESYVLREFDGLNSEEVAEILNVTPNNLWVMLSRARLKLRQCLQSHWFKGNK